MMKFKLQFKILMFSLIVIILFTVWMIFTINISNNEFESYIRLKEFEKLGYLADTLIDFYSETGGWEFLLGNRDLWGDLLQRGWLDTTPNEFDKILIGDNIVISLTYQQDVDSVPPVWDPLNLGSRIYLHDKEKKYIIGLSEEIPTKENYLFPI